MISESLTFISPYGRIHLVASETGLSHVGFLPATSEENMGAENKYLRSAQQQIQEYLSNQRKVFDIDLDLSFSNDFMKEALSIVRQIPFGETRSYGEIAKTLGKPMATRAVGGAMAHNPLLIVIPCHRVVAADGRLAGYAGGMENKIKLLELEGHKIVGEKLA